ncbi:hypothetical protein AB0C29_36505 [Actinoplanes sp. NPDC048791]|uniref:HAAS signaling domain-containing protein n=1 Tax=Actinoplanes sp. NPDC048791 TaxID=3154623 RepID=UPI0033F31F73
MITTAQDEINLYVFAVRAALGDLPESLRDELLEDLPEHLAEVAADGEGSLTDRLGSPEAYAADLRMSAGFVGGFPDPPGRTDQFKEMRDVALARLRVADVRLGPLFGAERASDFLVQLRPAWWVLRGYLAAMVLAWMLDDSGQPIGLLPRIGGSEAVALLLLAAGILGSIWLGRRSVRLSHWPQLALYAGSVVLVLVALGGFLSADSSSRGAPYADVNYDNSNPYGNIEDLFVYDEQGRLVQNARIFDQNGAPLRLGNAYCYDDSGNYTEVQTLTYPYCAERDPFRAPTATASAAAGEASGAPGANGPGPVPPMEDGSGVSPSVRPSPSPSATSPSVSPSPR